MVVDDEVDFLRLTKLNLENSGKFEVTTLSSAKDILSQLHSFKPDIILLDLIMPTTGGLDVCDMLNNDSLGKNIPVVILSALSKDTDKLKAYRTGIVDYLVKPIESKDLIVKIEKALEFKSKI